MKNKKVWLLYGLPDGRVEAFSDLKVAENHIALEYEVTKKTEVGPGVWRFGKKLFLKRQNLFGSNGLGH